MNEKVKKEDILEWLLNKKCTNKELAEHFGVAEITIRRRMQTDPELGSAKKFNQALGKRSYIKLSKIVCGDCAEIIDRSEIKDRRHLCNACFNKRLLKYNNARNKGIITDGKFYLYYLPEEHYIGITNNPKNRIPQHTYRGKIIDGWEIVAEYDNPKLCAFHEALMHLIGYNGSAYDNMLKSKGIE